MRRQGTFRPQSIDEANGMFLPGSSVKKKQSRPLIHPVLSGLVLPIVLAIAGALQTQKYRFISLVSFAVLSFAVTFSPRAWTWLQQLREKRRDDKLAAQVFSDFQRFARDFGDFVSVSFGPRTLHSVLLDACHNNQDELNRIVTIGRVDALHSWHTYFLKRLIREHFDAANLELAAAELNGLINAYTSQCVHPVFEHTPATLRQVLDDRTKSELNGFQQRLVGFLQQYSHFANSTGERLHTVDFGANFPLPKPL